MDFTGHRARSLARLCAYTLLVIFLISLLASFFPLPLEAPDRALAVLQELLERSTVPLVALLFLFAGLAGDALPAPWEVGLASWMRPLLRLAALGYLLTAIAVVGVAARIESTGITQLSGQVQSSMQELQNLRQEVNQTTDPESLRRLLRSQPRLIEAMEAQVSPLGQADSLREQQDLASELIDRAEANLRSTGLKRKADASGNLTRQTLRLSFTALAYALFYLLAGFLWPASVTATIERLRDAREARAAAEAEADDEPDIWTRLEP